MIKFRTIKASGRCYIVIRSAYLPKKITAVLTEHGMTKAYLHRFPLREDAKCSCGNE